MKKTNRTWIIIADGGEARVLISETGTIGLQQVPNSSFSDSQLATHEIVTDRQPSVRKPMGNTSHAVGPKTDPHKQRKMHFIKNLFDHVETAAENGAFEHLVVVAPPFILGEIRKDLSPRLQKLLHAEISHDYTHQTSDYIYQQLKDTLPH
jgi:protein required for attachment to host cells